MGNITIMLNDHISLLRNFIGSILLLAITQSCAEEQNRIPIRLNDERLNKILMQPEFKFGNDQDRIFGNIYLENYHNTGVFNYHPEILRLNFYEESVYPVTIELARDTGGNFDIVFKYTTGEFVKMDGMLGHYRGSKGKTVETKHIKREDSSFAETIEQLFKRTRKLNFSNMPITVNCRFKTIEYFNGIDSRVYFRLLYTCANREHPFEELMIETKRLVKNVFMVDSKAPFIGNW